MKLISNLKSFVRTLIVAGVAVLALSLAPAVSAQQYSTGIAIKGGTNNVSAATTNTTAFLIPAVRASTISIQPVFKLTGSGTSAVVFRFAHSLDSTNYIANAFSVSVTAAGSSVVTGISSLTVNESGWLKLTSIENPNASAITNLTLIYASKTR